MLLPMLVLAIPLPGAAQPTPSTPAGKGGGDAGTVAPAAPPPKPFVCPAKRRVTMSPQVLKKQLRAATKATEVKKLLAPLQLGLRWSDAEACVEESAPAEVVLDVFRARILSADTEDFVLQARGVVCGSLPMLAGVVLHPLAEKGVYCLTEMPFLPGMETSYSNYPPKVVFAFENLTEPVRQVFRVDFHQESTRSEDSAISYWEAREGTLEEIFKLESQSGVSFTFSTSSDVSVSAEGKEFPRQLRLKESVRNCGREITLPSGAVEHDNECSEASNEALYCYKRTAPDAPASYEKCWERRSLE
ncbi:hypothetical protein LY474_34265 [Myxococcus stipitatus]|uniref:hypothetical protein n=1 Tax=Myxococcus stipitatus TaxID=83455 RepID=UPI001F46F444|nr:hypothetical protein [Myxococcus stipitatus]MCE9672883.1 hypothetical protein [Myxococcus stipitatus]